MDPQTAFQITFDFFSSKPIVVEPSAAQVSSDGGLLPFRQLDDQIGLTQQFVEALSYALNSTFFRLDPKSDVIRVSNSPFAANCE